MKSGSLAPLIKKYYPEYYLWEKYPVDLSIPIRKVKDQWGILGNFYPVNLIVNGVKFDSSEQLFQMMKFTDREVLSSLHSKKGLPLKWEAKKWENEGLRRDDWGEIVIDVMKYCLQTKYDQCEDFKNSLIKTDGNFIVEDQTNMKTTKTGLIKPADTWGVVMEGEKYIGSNLLGRLLMELRDNTRLEYRLPQDMINFF